MQSHTNYSDAELVVRAARNMGMTLFLKRGQVRVFNEDGSESISADFEAVLTEYRDEVAVLLAAEQRLDRMTGRCRPYRFRLTGDTEWRIFIYPARITEAIKAIRKQFGRAVAEVCSHPVGNWMLRPIPKTTPPPMSGRAA